MFLSFYLLYNTVERKAYDDSYTAWCARLKDLIIFMIILIMSDNLANRDIANTLSIVFLRYISMTKKLIALISTKNKATKQLAEQVVNAINKYRGIEHSTYNSHTEITNDEVGRLAENKDLLLKDKMESILDPMSPAKPLSLITSVSLANTKQEIVPMQPQPGRAYQIIGYPRPPRQEPMPPAVSGQLANMAEPSKNIEPSMVDATGKNDRKVFQIIEAPRPHRIEDDSTKDSQKS